MNQKTGRIWTTLSTILCGIPGIFMTLGSMLVACFGLMADGPQLKLDTNLDRTSVIQTGGIGILIGLSLIAVWMAIRKLAKRRDFDSRDMR